MLDLVHEDVDGDGVMDVIHEDTDGDGVADLVRACAWGGGAERRACDACVTRPRHFLDTS